MKLTAQTKIQADLDTVWRYTQTPELHRRWDLRFTDIEFLNENGSNGSKRFRYATRIGFGRTIEGWGETIGASDRQTSVLRFGSDDPKSLISEGAGSWTYKPTASGIDFSTIYDYSVRYGILGRCFDSLVFRPLMIWATRWSFDRMRLWIEQGTPPEVALRMWISKLACRTMLGLVWIHEGIVPKVVFVTPDELALVARPGLYWPDPRTTLAILGAAEALFGIWIISGRQERLTATLSILAIIILSFLVVAVRPELLIDPIGGISKNLGLVACSLIVLLLAGVSPTAKQAKQDL